MAFSGFAEMFVRFAKVLCFNVPSPFFSLSQFFVVSLPQIVQQIDIHKFCEDKFNYINNSNENLYDSQINSKFAVIRKQIKKPK